MYDTVFTNEDMLELQSLLFKHNKFITTAESCTGGLVASMITEISGSSNIFNGAIITYSNKIKEQELNVKAKTLKKYGAVSVQVVEEMLEGVINKFDSDFAIAISGISGPNGGTKNKPVGTVIIGIKAKNITNEINILKFNGNRKKIQIQAAKYSLKKLLDFLKKTLTKKYF